MKKEENPTAAAVQYCCIAIALPLHLADQIPIIIITCPGPARSNLQFKCLRNNFVLRSVNQLHIFGAGPESGGDFVTKEQLEVAKNRVVQQASSRGKADRSVLSSATKLPPDSGPASGHLVNRATCQTCAAPSPQSAKSKGKERRRR